MKRETAPESVFERVSIDLVFTPVVEQSFRMLISNLRMYSRTEKHFWEKAHRARTPEQKDRWRRASMNARDKATKINHELVRRYVALGGSLAW